jgi:hypothetical protein
MKKIAGLALSFTVSFAAILVLASAAGFLGGIAKEASLYPPARLAELSGALSGALPAAFYFALLLGINYVSRNKVFFPAAFPVLLVFALLLSFGASLLFGRLAFGSPAVPAPTVKPGLLVSVAPGNPPTQAVLFQDSPSGSRALSLPRQPLKYEAGSSRTAQIAPFGGEEDSLLAGLFADFARSAGFFRAWFDAGLVPYAVYAGALALLLISIGCLVNISFWPLANLFFGALAFRGVLALEAFLNSDEIHATLASFSGGFLPESLITPLIFCGAGILVLLYAGLVFLARGRRAE